MVTKNGFDGEQPPETITPGPGEPGDGRFRRESETEWTEAENCVIRIDERDQGTLLETDLVVE